MATCSGSAALWYKMNFFEHSARVPLVVAGPGIAQRAVAEPVSLVDLLPTFAELAGYEGGFGMPLDGRSLMGLLTGGAERDGEAIGEYCAECASHPLFMIRRGKWKYIHCDIDPPLLYDLEADPEERENLAADARYADVASAFAAEVKRRWNSAAIRADVLRTQKQRRAVHTAMEAGLLTSWDYAPRRDPANEFVRNHVDWAKVQATRYPPWRDG